MRTRSTKPNVSTAITILGWLVDMHAPKPANPFGEKPSNEQRLAWLRSSSDDTWLPINTSMREPWLLAEAGLLEKRTCSPAVLKLTKKHALMQCYPFFRLAPLGKRWCELLLDSDDATPEPFFGSMLLQAMARPDDLALLRAEIDGHGNRAFVYLRGMQRCLSATIGDAAWQATIDWAALVLLGKGVVAVKFEPQDPARFDAFIAALDGVPA